MKTFKEGKIDTASAAMLAVKHDRKIAYILKGTSQSLKKAVAAYNKAHEDFNKDDVRYLAAQDEAWDEISSYRAELVKSEITKLRGEYQSRT